MDSHPPYGLYSDNEKKTHELQQLKQRVDDLEKWVERVAESVKLLCQFLKKG